MFYYISVFLFVCLLLFLIIILWGESENLQLFLFPGTNLVPFRAASLAAQNIYLNMDWCNTRDRTAMG